MGTILKPHVQLLWQQQEVAIFQSLTTDELAWTNDLWACFWEEDSFLVSHGIPFKEQS